MTSREAEPKEPVEAHTHFALNEQATVRLHFKIRQSPGLSSCAPSGQAFGVGMMWAKQRQALRARLRSRRPSGTEDWDAAKQTESF